MRDGFLWTISRHVYDDRIAGRSSRIAFGTGLGLLVAGAGVLPAVVVGGFTMAAAGALQGLWDGYKRKTGQISRLQLHAEHLATYAIAQGATPHTRASSYNNFFDTLSRFVEQNTVEAEHLSMMAQLKGMIGADIERTKAKNQSTGPLPDLYNKTQTLIGAWAEKVAAAAVYRVMDTPVRTGLEQCLDDVGNIAHASRALDIVRQEGFEEGPVEKSKELLRDKLLAIQKAIAMDGIDTGHFPEGSIVGQTAYLHGELARLGILLKPILTGHSQAPEHEQVARSRVLENTWFATFAKGVPAGARAAHETPEDVLAVYQAFYDTLARTAQEHPMELSVRALQQGALMHERLGDAIEDMHPSGQTLEGMQMLMHKTHALVATHCGQAANRIEARMQRTATQTGLDNAIVQLGQLSEGLEADVLIQQFAGADALQENRHQHWVTQAEALRATLALGIDETQLQTYTPERARSAIESFNYTIARSVKLIDGVLQSPEASATAMAI